MKFITTAQFNTAKAKYDQKQKKADDKLRKQFAKVFAKALAKRAKTYENKAVGYEFGVVQTADLTFDYITNNSHLTEVLTGYSNAGWLIVTAILKHKVSGVTYTYCNSYMFTSTDEAIEYFSKLGSNYTIDKLYMFDVAIKQWVGFKLESEKKK